jgi:hypothetical protein
MYVLPGSKTCDYCHGPLIERPRKITQGAGDSIIAANGSRTVSSR